MRPSKFVLGTAQLGLQYGIANKSGKPDKKQSKKIISTAWELGIKEFDTAQAYGTSEYILGESLKTLGLHKKVNIVTKIDINPEKLKKEDIKKQILESIKKLNASQLYGCLLHNEDDLDNFDENNGIQLRKCVSEGLIRYLGVSVYSPERALQALDIEDLQIIQIPANALDRRFAKLGIFEKARQKGRRVYIRSIYLQGLLLMEPEELSGSMHFAKRDLSAFRKIAEKYMLTPQKLAVGFINNAYPFAHPVIGAETAEQLRDTMKNEDYSITNDAIKEVNKLAEKIDQKVINPTHWGLA